MKLFSKIAALSVGLAMAVGVGVAVGSKKASEAKADYALSYTLDFDKASGGGTASELNETTAVSFLNTAAGSNIVASASNVAKAYNAKGSGGTGVPDKVLKLGSSKNAGTLTFTLESTADEISKAVFTAYNWPKKAVDLTVNGVQRTKESATGASSDNYEFEFAATREIAISVPADHALSITKIELYKASETPITYHSVAGTVEHGSVSPNSVADGATLTATITPNSGYKVPDPDSVTVTMGGSPVAFDYNSGVITVQNVTGDIAIVASCIALEEYSVSYVPVDHGSGAYNDSGLENSQYTLVAFDDTGIVAENGYRFKNYEIDSVSYAAGEKITLIENIEVSVIFELIPEGDEGLIKFGTNDVKIDSASATGNDSLGNTWTITTEDTTSFTANPAYYQVGSSSKPATSITFTTTISQSKKVASFEAKFGGFSGTAGDIALKVGDTTVGSGSLNAGTDVVVDASSQEVGTVLTITVTNIAKGVKVYYISYTLANASSKTLDIKLDQASSGPFNINYRSSSYLFYAMYGEDIIDADWTVGDSTILSVSENSSHVAVVNTLKDGTTTLTASAAGYNACISQVTVSAGTLSSISITGSMSKKQYTTSEEWNPGGFVVTATYSTGLEKDVTEDVSWSYNPAAPAENVDAVTATASYGGKSSTSSSQSVTVTVAHAGTAEDPFTVAEGIAKCVEIGNKSGGQGPWVTTGKISSIVQVLTSGFQNARFYITEDGKTTGASLYVYDCKYLENAGFTEETAANIVVGATVTVYGNLLDYNNNTPEYARGCYLLDIQAPETGDVDVTFEPASTSFEIGATGTFTASSKTSGATFAWSVDDSSVLSVNASTGAYQALALGVARVTVTASAGGKQGYAFVDFVVNGSASTYYTVATANTMASGVESGKTTAYYIYVEGYVKEFATSLKDGNPRAFDIMTLDESASIMVYTNVDPYADFIDGLSLGDRIVVKGKIQNYNGKYEIVEPEKVASNASAITFALGFISQTDAVCEGYDGESSNKAALEAIWEGLETSYKALYDNQKSVLMGAERDEEGTHVEQAVARYDYLVGKYGLDNFITGRTPVSFPSGAYLPDYQSSIDSSSSITIIVIVAVTSMTLLGVTLVLRKRKHQ